MKISHIKITELARIANVGRSLISSSGDTWVVSLSLSPVYFHCKSKIRAVGSASNNDHYKLDT